MRKIPAKLITVLLLIATMLCSLAIMSNAATDPIVLDAEDIDIDIPDIMNNLYGMTQSYDVATGIKTVTASKSAQIMDAHRFYVKFADANVDIDAYPYIVVGMHTANTPTGQLDFDVSTDISGSRGRRLWGRKFTVPAGESIGKLIIDVPGYTGGEIGGYTDSRRDGHIYTDLQIRPGVCYQTTNANLTIAFQYVAFFATQAEAEAFEYNYEVPKFNINFFDNTKKLASKQLKLTEPVGALPTVSPPKGYVLKEWNTEPDGTGEVVTSYTFLYNDINAYAIYEIAPLTDIKVVFMVDNKEFGAVYATTSDILTNIAPLSKPSIDGYYFLKWDYENSVGIDSNADLTKVIGTFIKQGVDTIFVDAVLIERKDLDFIYYSADDDTIWAQTSGMYSATRLYDSNEGYYLHYVNPGSGTNGDIDRANIKFLDHKATEYPVMKMSYRVSTIQNNTQSNICLNPYFGSRRLWGGNVGTLISDGNWHTKTVDLSTVGWTGGDTSFKNWASVGSNKMTGFLLRPFIAKSDENYFDISYVAFFKTVEEANAFNTNYFSKTPVNFKNYDGSIFKTLRIISDTKIKFPYDAPENKGYYFESWNIPDNYIVTESISINPIFKELLTVSFMIDEEATYEEYYYQPGETLILPEGTPEIDGYVFKGWLNAEEGTEVTGDAIYYAEWAKLHKVEFFSSESSNIWHYIENGCPLGDAPVPPEISGYEFIGWVNEDNEEFSADTIIFNDVKLYSTYRKLPTISVSDNIGYTGELMKVDVTIESNPGIAFMRLFLDYDSDILTLVGVEDNGLLGESVHTDDLNTLPYVLFWNNPTINENIAENGTLVTLIFEVAEDAPVGETSNIALSYSNLDDDIMDTDFNPVDFYLTDGVITFKKTIYGDVNDDGKVTAIDGAYIARYLANWQGYEADKLDLVMSDVNLNGEVDAMDSVIISRHLARWTGYLTLPIEIE